MKILTRWIAALVGSPEPQWLERQYNRFFLPIWFLPITAALIISAFRLGWVGIDAEIYLRGSSAWLAGADPWATLSAIEGDPRHLVYHYSALPTTTILLAPLTLLPEAIGAGVIVAASAFAAVYVVRRLRLPLYWLWFPPLVEGVLVGNPSIAMLALLLASSPFVRAIGPLLKVYGFIPLLGERDRRAILLALIGFGLTLLALPLWIAYLGDIGTRSSRLLVEAEGGYSGANSVGLGLIAAAAISGLLVLRDWRTAGWLTVPALWPATQFHYSTLAMPVMHPILAFGLAIHDPRAPVLTIAAYVAWRLLLRATSMRAFPAGPVVPVPAEPVDDTHR